MSILSTRNIIVAGTPGAWVNVVSGLLENRGWQITWPGQDIDICDGHLFLNHNKQNIEIQNIHQCVCDAHGVGLMSDALPRFYGQPYPGPKEFLAMFEGPVVISGISVAPFLDLWVDAADVVIDIRSTKEEDIEMMDQWVKHAFTPTQLESIRSDQVTRYDTHLKLFPKVFTMTNSEVRDRRFDRLVGFLDSVFR